MIKVKSAKEQRDKMFSLKITIYPVMHNIMNDLWVAMRDDLFV